MTAPEPVAPPAQDELRESLIKAWDDAEWIVVGSVEDRRIVMAEPADRIDALLTGPLAELVAERDTLRATLTRVHNLHTALTANPDGWAYNRETAGLFHAALTDHEDPS